MEVVRVLLALELIRRESTARSATIRLDNQAVIQTLGCCSVKLAQALLNLIHEGCAGWLTSNRHGSRQLSINWVSGHDGVYGNEYADEEARKVACNRSSLENELPEVLQGHALPYSLAGLGGKFKESLRVWWKAMWVKSPGRGGWTRLTINFSHTHF